MEDQLKMGLQDLENLPSLQCPDGYHIRTYQEGDEIHWARIMDIAFVDQGRTAQDTYANVINQPDFDPNGFLFAIYADRPIGIENAAGKRWATLTCSQCFRNTEAISLESG